MQPITELHYIVKNSHSPIQNSGFRDSNHLHGHRCMKPSTGPCKLLLQMCEKEFLALRSSQHGTVTGCHLCNKYHCEIPLQLNIPHITVSGVITKWEQLGRRAMTAATNNQGGGGQLMLRRLIQFSLQITTQSPLGALYCKIKTLQYTEKPSNHMTPMSKHFGNNGREKLPLDRKKPEGSASL